MSTVSPVVAGCSSALAARRSSTRRWRFTGKTVGSAAVVLRNRKLCAQRWPRVQHAIWDERRIQMKPVSKRGPRGLLTSFFFEPRSLRRWTLLLQVLRRLVRRRAARRPAAPLLARLYLRMYHRCAPSRYRQASCAEQRVRCLVHGGDPSPPADRHCCRRRCRAPPQAPPPSSPPPSPPPSPDTTGAVAPTTCAPAHLTATCAPVRSGRCRRELPLPMLAAEAPTLTLVCA